MKLPCMMDGCSSFLESNEPISPSCRFLCRHHTKEEHLAANNRNYNPDRDESDKQQHFQEYQFDKKIRRSGKTVKILEKPAED